MKNKLALLTILMLTVFTLIRCTKDNGNSSNSCVIPAPVKYYASVNVYDTVLGVYTQTFDFTQTETLYTNPNCGTSNSSTDLKITNIMPYTATYVYTISYNLNFVSWTKQGSITIGPKSTVDVGNINDSLTRIDLGQLVVVYGDVSYN